MNSTLLEGNIRKQLTQLALPLLVGNILQQLYNTVDTLVIGKFLGTDAFSAAGIAGTIMNLFIFVLTGFCTGISVLLAQLYGNGDRTLFRREVFVSLSIGTGITLVLSGLFMALMRPVLVLIDSPEHLIPYIEAYLSVIIGGMIANFFYNLFSGLLRAIGNTRAATFFLFVAVMVNAVVDYVFVALLGFGIAGAAWATVLSQLLSAVCCLIYILHYNRELLCGRADMHYDKNMVRDTLTFGFSSALHQSSLYIGKIFVQGAVNALGTAGIAAYTATTRIEGFANSIGTSVGQAASVFISQNYGAKKTDRVRDGLKQGMVLSLGLGLALAVIMFVTARPALLIFLDSSEETALRYGVEYLHLIAFFYLMCFSGNMFVGYFRGVGHVYIPLAATTMHITVRALLSYALTGALGLRAVAWATGAGWLLMTVFQILMMKRTMKGTAL